MELLHGSDCNPLIELAYNVGMIHSFLFCLLEVLKVINVQFWESNLVIFISRYKELQFGYEFMYIEK